MESLLLTSLGGVTVKLDNAPDADYPDDLVNDCGVINIYKAKPRELVTSTAR